jgi:hypothetical protein
MCLPRLARAADVRSCIEAHTVGQEQNNAGTFLEARESFELCSSAGCPSAIREECGRLLVEVRQRIPRLRIRAKANGEPITDVTVIHQGIALARELGGAPLEFAPGRKALILERADGTRRELDVLLADGEGERTVVVDFTPEARPEPAPVPAQTSAERRGWPWPAYALGGAGAAALGTFAFFALQGRQRESELEDCRGRCSRETYDRMQRSYLGADVALGAAVLSLGSASLFIAFGPRPRREAEPVLSRRKAPHTQVAVLPTTHGVLLRASARF